MVSIGNTLSPPASRTDLVISHDDIIRGTHDRGKKRNIVRKLFPTFSNHWFLSGNIYKPSGFYCGCCCCLLVCCCSCGCCGGCGLVVVVVVAVVLCVCVCVCVC